MVDEIRVGSRMRLTVLTMVLCVAAGCASSDAPDGSEGEEVVAANESSAAEAADPNEMICRRERATGSHFSRRVCRTRAQIEAEKSATQDLMRQNRGGVVNPGTSGG